MAKLERYVGGEYHDCSTVEGLKTAIVAKLKETGKAYDVFSMASDLACDGPFLRDLPIVDAMRELVAEKMIKERGGAGAGTEFWLA